MAKKLLFLWLPVIFWCFLIFYLSSKPTVKTSEVYFWDFILKKNAHLFEFFILYILSYRAINKKNKITKKGFFYPLIFIILYAISDEYHQSFTPGREARVRDIIIDGFGGLIAIWCLKNLFLRLRKPWNLLHG